MIGFLKDFGQYILMAIAVIEALLVFGLFSELFQVKKFVVFLTIVFTLGLFFSNVMPTIIRFIGETSWTQSLSHYSYVVHGALAGLLVIISLYLLEPTTGGQLMAWGIGLLLMVVGAVTAWFSPIEKVETANIVRYVAGSSTPTWMNIISFVLPIISIAMLLLAGIAIFSQKKNVVVILAAILLIVPYAVVPLTDTQEYSFLIHGIAELLMIVFLLGYYSSLKKEV